MDPKGHILHASTVNFDCLVAFEEHPNFVSKSYSNLKLYSCILLSHNFGTNFPKLAMIVRRSYITQDDTKDYFAYCYWKRLCFF